MLRKLKKKWNKWVKQFDPLEKEFNQVFPLINTVEGFLKSPQQERWFFRTAKKAPEKAVIVEIGSFKGRSTVSFGFGVAGSQKHIYAIDLFEGDGADYGDGDFQNIFQNNIDRCGLGDYVTPIREFSTKVAQTWDRPIDILFIDGSHEYEDVKADFLAFHPFVKKNGIIAFHDIKGKWDGVIRFWTEVQQDGYLTDIGQVSSLGYGRKVK
ncbi:MAG: class I SAM-dependent methyltransferase [Cyclobacteriaceae bacterium]